MPKRLESPPSHPAVTSPEAPPPRPEPLLLRLDAVAGLLSVDRRTLERWRSAGGFPRPDVVKGRLSFWTPATLRAWIERGGRT